MLHHHQDFNSNHLSSCSPTYKIHNRRASTGDGEFNFWGACKSIYVENFSDHITDGDLEFQAKAQMDQDGFGVYSSPLWEANTSIDIKCESSTCYELSEYRRELMKMIHNMPESCYELSLKDIVDEKHGLVAGPASPAEEKQKWRTERMHAYCRYPSFYLSSTSSVFCRRTPLTLALRYAGTTRLATFVEAVSLVACFSAV